MESYMYAIENKLMLRLPGLSQLVVLVQNINKFMTEFNHEVPYSETRLCEIIYLNI